MLNRAAFFVLVVVVAGGVAVPASAQWHDSLGGNWNNPSSALIGTMINNRIMADTVRKASQAETTRSEAPAESRPGSRYTRPPVTPGRLTFRPVGKNIVVKELAAVLTDDPSARRELVTAFEQILAGFDQKIRQEGETPNDVGLAAAMFLSGNYFAATGRELTDAQEEGVKRSFRDAYAQNEAFAQAGDRDRQRLYESLVILALFPVTGAMQSAQSGDRQAEKNYRRLGAELLKGFYGIPVDKIRLTRNGFTLVD